MNHGRGGSSKSILNKSMACSISRKLIITT
jgi:hypothetical protein